MSEKDGGPAFPRPYSEWRSEFGGGVGSVEPQDGMTLRDYFAGQVLSSVLVGARDLDTIDGPVLAAQFKRAAEVCYALADAMLAARELS